MEPGTSVPDVDSLVAGSFAVRNGRVCWAQELDGPIREYLDALSREYAAGRMPVWARVVETLAEHFDVQIVYNTVKNHVTGRCSCPK